MSFLITDEGTQLDEQAFQGWYKERAGRLGLNPNPDDPGHYYDYRAAYLAGAEPDPATGHWPSQFKTEGHPRTFMITDELPQAGIGEGALPAQELPAFAPSPTLTFGQRIKEGLLDLIGESPEKLEAKNAAALYYAEQLGVRPSEAFDHLDELNKSLGGRQVPTTTEVLGVASLGPVTMALAANPVGALLGLGTFYALSEAESGAVSLVKGERYQLFKQKGLKELLPEEAGQLTKAVVDTLDFVAKGLATAKLFKASPRLIEATTKKIIIENGLPQKIYINAADLYREMQTGKVLPPEQLEIIKSLNMTSAEWRQAVTRGLNIEIPAEQITTITDRPWFARIKRLFKLDPAQEIRTEAGGPPTYRFGEEAPKEAPVPGYKGELPSITAPTMRNMGILARNRRRQEVLSRIMSPEPPNHPSMAGKTQEQIDKEFAAWEANVVGKTPGEIVYSETRQTLPPELVEASDKVKAARASGSIFDIEQEEASLHMVIAEFNKTARAESNFAYYMTESGDVERVHWDIEDVKKLFGTPYEPRIGEGIKLSEIHKEEVPDIIKYLKRKIRHHELDEVVGKEQIRILEELFPAESKAEATKFIPEGEGGEDQAAAKAPGPALEEFKQATEWMTEKLTPEEKPGSEILAFIRKAGGINPKLAQGEMARFTYKESGTTGLTSPKGLSPDDVRQRLAEEGYLDEESTINDLYDLMDLELYRYKYGRQVEDLPISEVMAGKGRLEEAIKAAERAIKKAEAAGIREGVKLEKERKVELEAKKRARKEAREFIEKMARVIMRPVGKSVDFYYREAIDNLRAGIDPSFRSQKTIEDRDRLRRFLQGNPEKLEAMPLSLLDRISKKALNEYTMGELEDIAVETVQLRRLGRLKKDLDRAQLKRQLQGDVDQLAFTMLKGGIIEPRTEPITAETAREMRRGGKLRQLRASTLDPPRLFDKLDGGQDFRGPAHDLFYNQVKNAEDVKLRQVDKRTDAGMAKLEELGIKLKDLAAIREVGGRKFSVDEMIDVYIGMKNPRKFLAIIYGNNISPELAGQIVAALTPEEQVLGDWIVEEYGENYNRLREAYIDYADEDFGHEPNYTPLRRRDIMYNTLQAEMADEFLYRQYLRKGYVPKGFTIARQEIPPEYQIPAFLGAFSTWLEQVPKQEQFINLAGLTKYLHRVASHEAFKGAIRQAYGDEYLKTVENYISRSANPNIYKAYDGLSRFLSAARQNAAVAILAMNLSVLLKQPASLPLYLADAGVGHLLAAAAEFMLHPFETYQFVIERDPQVKHRSLEREMEEFKVLSANPKQWEIIRKKIGMATMQPLYWFDKLAVIPGWKAVYSRALADNFSEEEAIRLARNTTLRTQNAAAPSDIAEIFATSDWLNVLQMFTSQMNKIYGFTTHDIPKHFQQGRWYKAFLGILGLVLSAEIVWMIENRRLPESPGDAVEALAEQTIGSVPIIGPAIMAKATGGRSQSLPIMTGLEALGGVVSAKKDEDKLNNLLKAICYTLGLPFVGPSRVVKAAAHGRPEELLGGRKEKKRRF